MKIEIKRYAGFGIVIFLTWLAIYYWPSAVGVLGSIIGAAQPLIFGAIIAYVVNILMKLYEKWYVPKSAKPIVKKTRGPVCMLLAFVSIVAAVILLLNLVVPQLFACIHLLVQEIPPQIDRLIVWLKGQENLWPEVEAWLGGLNFDWDGMVKKMLTFVSSGATGIMTGAVSTATSLISMIPDIVFTLIFAMYMLLGKHTLLRQAKRLLKTYVKPGIAGKVQYVAGVAHTSFTNFIVGQVTEALIIGVLCTAGMMLLRLPYAAMTGAVVGFTALIPIVGAYIGTIVGAFMIFTVNPMQAIVFIIFLLVLQQIEGNLIYPHTVGSSIGLPGIWVLAAVTICGGLFGIAGMLVGVPAAATLYRLLQTDINRRDPHPKPTAE